MIPITPFEERVAYDPLTGVNVARQRLFESWGWRYHVDDLADLAAGEVETCEAPR